MASKPTKRFPRRAKPQVRPLYPSVRKRFHPLDRYGYAPVSHIADQWFCELKVDLELSHSEDDYVQIQQENARAVHATLAAGAEALSARDRRQRLQSGETVVLVECLFQSRFGPLAVWGIPDAVCFQRQEAVCVLDYKFKSFRTSPQLFESDEVQLQLYGWLLEQSGFQVQGLILAGVFFSPASRSRIESLTQAQRHRIPLACWRVLYPVISSIPTGRSMMHQPFWARSDTPVIRGVTAALVAVRYHPAQATKHLAWAAPYWLRGRKPMPTRKPSRCERCRVNAAQLCGVALAPYQES